jgi:hypothetical protein
MDAMSNPIGAAGSGAAAGAALGPWGAAGGAALGIIGDLLSSGDDQAIRQALEMLKNTNVEAGDSSYATDPNYNAALAAMRGQYENGGMSAADKMASQQGMEQAAQAQRMQRGAMEQNMAARGMGGGGAEIAARAIGDQGLTTAQHGYGVQQAGMAQQRALDALKGWGGMSGERAGAKDAIARFNASQRLGKATAMLSGGGMQTGYANQSAQDQRNRLAGYGTLAGSAADYFIGDKKKQP